MSNLDADESSKYSYFGIQSSWGVTKHFGGLRATYELASLCQISRGKSVLVVGCGIGLTPCHLAQNFGCQVTGVDLSEKMVAWSRKRVERKGLAGQIELRMADAQELPFETECFDAVLIESVNAFIPDKPRAFAEYARVTRHGGYVGMNEGTWVKFPPPAELLEFIERSMQAEFQLPEAWQALLVGAGLEVSAVHVYPIKMLRQRLDENAGLDLSDWLDRLRAIGNFINDYITDVEMRKYAKSIMPSRAVVRDLFTYLGYGNYAGRKP
jgi:cyclopropane fatty-acyl-phospholipid synthase-like methyltransferase